MKLVIRLSHGSIHRTLADPAMYEHAHFEGYHIVLDFAKAMADDTYQKTYLEMTVPELRAFIADLRASRKDDYQMRRAWVEYHRKFAFPFACVVFGLLAIPMGVVPPRSGRGQGFTMAIFILCAYYLLFRVGETLGWNAVLHPFFAMWAPNILFGIAGAYFLWRKSREKPVWIIDAISAAVYDLMRLIRRRSDEAEEES
jgi:lipopolysaccharide export system permease protein